MANPDNVLSTMLQSLFISRDDFDEHSGDKDSNYRQFPFPYYQQADFPIFMLGGGQYIAPGSWSNLTDGEFHHFRFTNDGLLRTDASVSIGNLSVGSTDGVNYDSGIRTSASWRSEALLWGLDTGANEIAGQVETDVINAVSFRPLMVGGADLLGVPQAFLFDDTTGRLLVDSSANSRVGSTDGVAYDAGLRVSSTSWRSENLIWGTDQSDVEKEGQVEDTLVNQAAFRPLIVGGANLIGVPQTFLFDDATGRLIVDSVISSMPDIPVSTFDQRFYTKALVANIDQTINFGFTATEITIINDDTTNPINFNYSAAATLLTEEVLAGDGWQDNFASNNVHLLGSVVGPTTVRVFARA